MYTYTYICITKNNVQKFNRKVKAFRNSQKISTSQREDSNIWGMREGVVDVM